MRLLATFSASVLLISSCSDDNESSASQNNIPGQQLIKQDSTKMNNSGEDKATSIVKTDLNDLLESFIYCRENSESSLTCKYFIAKAIDLYYGINDFKGDDGNYVDYEFIRPRIESSERWKRIGDAEDQSVLDLAQQHVNDGKAALAISENGAYGHVVLILPGSLHFAPNWKLNCPNVASFFMISGVKPYVDKSMAYSWSSPVGVGVYIRE